MDRKIVDKDWNNQMIAVRTKITKALEGIPSNAEVGVLPSASDVTYSTCKSIMKLLGKTESSEKAMFGWGGFKVSFASRWYNQFTQFGAVSSNERLVGSCNRLREVRAVALRSVSKAHAGC